MIDDLLKAWRLVYATWKDKQIRTGMYYYLVGCIFVVGGLYFYLMWAGFVGFAIIFSALVGVQKGIPITIVQGAGIIIVIRYMILGGVDAMAKRTPDDITQKLAILTDKVNALHRLAFEIEDESDDKIAVEVVKKKGK